MASDRPRPPKLAKDRPRSPQYTGKRPQDSPRSPSRWLHMAPNSQDGPKIATGPQDSPRSPSRCLAEKMIATFARKQTDTSERRERCAGPLIYGDCLEAQGGVHLIYITPLLVMCIYGSHPHPTPKPAFRVKTSFQILI